MSSDDDLNMGMEACYQAIADRGPLHIRRQVEWTGPFMVVYDDRIYLQPRRY